MRRATNQCAAQTEFLWAARSDGDVLGPGCHSFDRLFAPNTAPATKSDTATLTLLFFHPTILLLHNSFTLLFFDPTILLLHNSFALLSFYSTILWLCYSFTTQFFYSTITLLCYAFTLLFFCSTILWLYYSFTLLFFYSSILWLYYSFTLLYFDTIFLLYDHLALLFNTLRCSCLGSFSTQLPLIICVFVCIYVCICIHMYLFMHPPTEEDKQSKLPVSRSLTSLFTKMSLPSMLACTCKQRISAPKFEMKVTINDTPVVVLRHW